MPREIKFSPEALKAREEMSRRAQESISKMPPGSPEEFMAQYERLNGKQLRPLGK